MKQKSIFIILSLVFSLAIQGCYTQLAWFYPSPEEEEEIFEPYSRAGNRPNLSLYAQETGSTMPLSYSMMHNRFNPLYSSYYGYSSFYNPYNFYGSYGNGYGMGFYDYGYGYSLGGYNMVIPGISENEIRKFTKSRDRNTGTNLNTVRTRTQSQQSSSSRNGDSSYGGSSSLSSSRSSSGSSGSSSGGSSSSSGSSGGTRATRRN